MSEDNQSNQSDSDQAPPANELEMLKGRASLMGIQFSNNIGIEALKLKIKEKMEGPQEPVAADVLEEQPQANALEQGAAMAAREASDDVVEAPRKKTLREFLHDDAMKLIRVRITNLDPKKKDLPGEVLTVANEYIGTVKKYVPYGEHTEDGYHIPNVLYEFLKARKFLHITTTRDRRTGTQAVKQKWAPEFALEILEPLTREELNQLAMSQTAAGSLDSADQA